MSLIHNVLQRGVTLRGSFLNRVNISGHSNLVVIGEKTMMNHCEISVMGHNCRLIIVGGGTNINNCHIQLNGYNCELEIAALFTMNGGSIDIREGKKVTIGDDCMFSSGINITTTDCHSIYSIVTNERINQARDVKIGNHVWLGRNVTVLKGSEIADDVIVGSGSIVTSKLTEPHSIYVGNPAKKVKSGTTWGRSLVY